MSHKIRFAPAVALSFLLSFALSAPLHAQEHAQFNLPSQPLAESLKALGIQARINVLVNPGLVDGRRAPALEASLTTQEALNRLLTGTDLEYHFVDDQTVVIRQKTVERTTSAAADERIRLAQADETAPTSANPTSPNRAAPTSGNDERRTRDRVELEELVVTVPEVLIRGSRTLNMDIRRSRDDAQPYVIFEREKIERSGAQDLETFLRDSLPMNASGLPNSQWVTSAGNQSNFNLRGLGANQTLILIDGHRAAPGPSYGSTPRQSDINGIPLSAIERIEVLPATASGIYGGSATGGVINVVLRRDYSGAEIKATYGNTFASDVASRRFDFNAGLNLEDGRTNVLLISSWSDENPISLSERPELVERYYDIVRANAPALLLPPNSPPLGSTPNIRSADGSNLVLDDGTALNSPNTFIPTGYAGAATDGTAALVANAGNYDLALANSLQNATGGQWRLAQAPRNVAVRLAARREFSTRVQGFVEASRIETETAAPWGTAVTGCSSLNPYRVSATAPNNPFNSDILVTVPTDSLAASLNSEHTQSRAIGGVIVALPAGWQGEMDYTWTRVRDGSSGMLDISTGADVAAVASGAVDVLRDTNLFPIDLSGLMTARPLGVRQEVSFEDVALRFAGPVLNLPAGPIGVSTLLEYRSEKYADALQNQSSGLQLLYPARSAAATSLYLETKIPLVSRKNRRAGIEALEVQLAARADEYRTVGATGFLIVGSDAPLVTARNETRSVNPTLAIRYQPVSDLVMRLSYGTGFVAPDVSQLASSIALGPVTIFDPRRGGTPTTLPVGQVLQGGNPDLGPEESESWSAGFVLTPRFAPGLRLSLDYIRIEKTDNITIYPTGVQGLVNDETLFPERIERGPNLPGDEPGWAGPITFLNYTRFNIASAEVEAFDLQLDYTWPTRLGTFSFSGVATRQTHYRTQSLAGQPTLENVGLQYNNPRAFTGSAGLTWQRRDWSAGWLARYVDDYLTANPALPTNAAMIALQGNGGRVPSQTYHDLFVSWEPQLSGAASRVLDDTQIRLNIRNVFDEMPPFDAFLYNFLKVYHSPSGDPLGATWQLAVTKRF